MSIPAGLLDVAPEVEGALAAGRPVVALESTLISHGLPHPANLEVARAAEAAVAARASRRHREWPRPQAYRVITSANQ